MVIKPQPDVDVTTTAPTEMPTKRRLRVFAFDPSLSTELENYDVSEVTVGVRWETDLKPGPVGEYLEVIDVDPASDCVYAPIDLNNPALLAKDGHVPSEGNPHFHQQMVYAVAMSTIQHFERSLGRKVMWSDQRFTVTENKKQSEKWAPTERLRIYPHALRENNAYYDSEKKALLFGYFPAQPAEVDLAMPGGLVFTCLSHDIIAHETTHAILDGIQPHFLEPSNRDVLAFHEAFSDLVALFQHFTYPEVLSRQIARARGNLSTETLLGQLAMQFGKASGERCALRDAIGEVDEATNAWRRRKPDPAAFQKASEPHDRGALFVAAVFDAYLAIYRHRTRDLFRIATGGTGVLPDGDLHPDLVRRLANEAAKVAEHLLTMSIRAVDYCPPVDITFGDYLRALITADFDVMPEDERNYRVAIVEAFRSWGIYPEDVRTLSIESLRWNSPDDATQNDQLKPFLSGIYGVLNDHDARWGGGQAWEELRSGVDTTGKAGFEPRRKLTRMELNRRTDAISARLHEVIREMANRSSGNGRTISKTIFGLNVASGHEADTNFRVANLCPIRRPHPDGGVKEDLLLQIVQRRPGYFDQEMQKTEDKRFNSVDASAPELRSCDFKFRGGTTFIIDLETYQLRYAIQKSIFSQHRMNRQREYLMALIGLDERELYFGKTPDSMRLAHLHGRKAIHE